jgi:hypothetical protein
MRPALNLLPIFLAGCQSWPTHSTLDPTTPDAIEAGLDSRYQVDMVWTDDDEEEGSSDAPESMHGLLHGEGLALSGSLIGWGWDRYAEADRPGDCGDLSVFPPQDVGNYVGDVDWFGVYVVQEKSTLCVSVKIEPPPAAREDDLFFDLLGFRLDPCGIPSETFLGADEKALGWGLGGWTAEWSQEVKNGDTIGIALAGYHPNDSALSMNYLLALSLVPSLDDGPGICPYIPDP